MYTYIYIYIYIYIYLYRPAHRVGPFAVVIFCPSARFIVRPVVVVRLLSVRRVVSVPPSPSLSSVHPSRRRRPSMFCPPRYQAERA